jgi:hypothetical protein
MCFKLLEAIYFFPKERGRDKLYPSFIQLPSALSSSARTPFLYRVFFGF